MSYCEKNKQLFADQFNHELVHKHLSAKLLTDSKILSLFFKNCEAFIRLVFNHGDTDQEAHDFIHERPKNKSEEDKLPMGIFNTCDELLAVFDVIMDYPHVDSWYIGLLLLSPMLQSQKLGSEIFHCFEKTVKIFHGKEINLIVQEKNPEARKFWEKLGFSVIRESQQELAQCENRVFHMQKMAAKQNANDAD